jgi:hypothetical protein
MDQVLRDARLEHCAQAFVDDLLIYSQDFESHVQACGGSAGCIAGRQG